MHSRLVLMLMGLLLLLAALLLVPRALAGYGSGDPRIEKLYRSFVAPCCWREDLTIHDSSAARQVRAQIDEMVAAGRSDEQIKAALVYQYGQRILIVPEGPTRRWLFRAPWVFGGIGLAGVFLMLRHMRRTAPALAESGANGAGSAGG
jgi:cytochrome c-type biogenesis protein CcmH